MSGIRPYKINVPEDKIQRLKQKLALVDFPPEIEDDKPWARGVPLSEMKRLVSYWRDQYDWRKTEERLNQIPQFTTDIDVSGFGTYSVHFVHQQSSRKGAIPLLFLHGWPGNFTEVSKMLPLLVNPDTDDQPAFHVVAPSLIDYGFSDRAAKKGFNSTQHAHTYHALMQKLGYEKYVLQGGDVGSTVSRRIVQEYPDSIGAHLLNMTITTEPKEEDNPDLYKRWKATTLTDEEKSGMKQYENFIKEGFGYNKLQQTKPQTIGYSMADSPVGLLAWIYEKMHEWSDEYPWTEDEVLQWVSIYYFSTPGPNASQHVYYEGAHTPRPSSMYSPVPLGVSRFPVELMHQPRIWHEQLGPVVFWSVHEKGGHFAAWERPEDLAGDARRMFGRDGPVAGCCGEGRTGY